MREDTYSNFIKYNAFQRAARRTIGLKLVAWWDLGLTGLFLG